MVNYARAYYNLRRMIKHAFWSSAEIKKYRDRKVRDIVRYAYDFVPFYREKFKKEGVNPADIRTVDDLSKLPIIGKDEVRQNAEQMVSREYNVTKLKMLRTSGSTGEPLHFYITSQEDELRKAKHLRANIVCGQKMRDRWVTITSPIYFNQATRLQMILGIYAPMSVSVFDDVEAQISIIEKLEPNVLDGYASSLLLLAKEAERRGSKHIKPQFLISGADLIDFRSREFVEKVFGVPFYDQYGAAEFERLAWQCKEKQEYHIDADSVALQFVDRDGGEVAPGETGEIVCTSFFNYAMPFIRYAVGDIGKASDKDTCPCGRTFPLMKIVEGRKDSIIVLPDRRSLSSFAFIAAMYRLSYYKHIEKFRVVQKRRDYFEFLIKLKAGDGTEKSMCDLGSAHEELVRCFSQTFNIDANEVTFAVNFVDNIPLDPSGKFRVVVSEVDRD